MFFSHLLLFVLSFVLASSAQAMPLSLQKIVAEIAQEKSLGHLPVVISDLDETLIDSTTRRFFSFKKAMRERCGTDRIEATCRISAGLNLEEFLALPNRYDQNQLFDHVGLSNPIWSQAIQKRMIDIYLSGEFMDLDQSVPGATEFIQALKNAGASFFYISSRFIDTQTQGTLHSLEDIGMLAPGESEQVILRARGMNSIDFKKQSFEKIKQWTKDHQGTIKLVMENEPENMNAMTALFPEASAVFIDGAFLKPTPLQSARVVHYKNFR